VLCLGGKWFLCRHCYALPYTSHLETAQDRHCRKVRKIRDRLGTSHNLTESVWPWRKPKGMHWRTWEQLRQQEEQAQRLVLGELSAAVGSTVVVSRLRLGYSVENSWLRGDHGFEGYTVTQSFNTPRQPVDEMFASMFIKVIAS